MKKIIAILTALAVVSMAFAQTVSITNTVSTNPSVYIDGSKFAWGFGTEPSLREQVEGTATTADGRATVWGRARLDLNLLQPNNADTILSISPRWKFTNDMTAAAVIKPVDSIEIKVGNRDGLNRWFGPSIAWYNSTHTYLKWTGNGRDLKGISGCWENIHGFRTGAYVGFTGVEGLYVGAGVATDNWPVGENYNFAGGSWLKKGAYGPFQAGATYDADLFSVGAKWVGEFGGADAKNTDTDAKYNAQNIYAGFTFKGLQDAKVGTTIGAAVDFDTHKKSDVMGTNAYTAFAVSANADMNFRNGITDSVAVTVGYVSEDGKKSKVLPFYIGNTLGYKVADDASFSLYTAYQQGGLEKSLKSYTDGEKVDSSLVILKPSFGFSMGAHSFSFGVETAVINQLAHYNKTAKEWAYTALYGKAAVVNFPISWSYTF